MNERGEFQSWFDREYPIDTASGGRTKYRSTSVMDLMFASWQAALEAAAVCAETALCECCYSESERENGDEIAFQIRNRLKAKEQS